MQTTESFGRGRIAEAITNTQSVPFTLSVSKVPNGTNQYITISPDTDNEEIFYYTTKTGTVGGVGTLNITGRGYYPHNNTQNSANYKSHPLNIDYKLSLNHIIINGKSDYTDLISTANGLGASLIGIEDLNTHFVGDTVEEALEELALGAPGVADASETVAGKVELSTDAQLASGTTVGETTARLIPSNSNTTTTQVANKIPVLNGSGVITNFINTQADGASSETEKGLVERATDAEALSGTDTTRYISPKLARDSRVYKIGTTTYDVSTASGVQNIAHGLGVIPKYVKLKGRFLTEDGINDNSVFCETEYNGIIQISTSLYKDGNPSYAFSSSFVAGITGAPNYYATGVITFDATNIIITWTKINTPTGILTLNWTAIS